MMPDKPKLPGRSRLRSPRATVLVVEDDEEVLFALTTVIEEEGWRVATAKNGREALSVLETVRPDLMLIDLFMPVMGGIELLRMLKRDERYARIPRLVM